MNTGQLNKCIDSDDLLRQQCLGAFASNCLPHLHSFPAGIVANVDPDNKPGKHWIGIYIDADGHGDFFDSYGRPPRVKAFQKFLQENCGSDWDFNKHMVQSPFSSACGQHVVHYLHHRTRGEAMGKILAEFVPGKLEENDQRVTEWVNERYDLASDAFDVQHVINQICTALKML